MSRLCRTRPPPLSCLSRSRHESFRRPGPDISSKLNKYIESVIIMKCVTWLGHLICTISIFLIFTLVSCSRVEHHHPNGYLVYKTSPSTIGVYRDIGHGLEGDFSGENYEYVVGALISQYARIDKLSLLIGLIVATDEVSIYKSRECPGWFIVDMITHDVKCGLSADELKQVLGDRRVTFEDIDWIKVH